jgi:hypothetical protein
MKDHIDDIIQEIREDFENTWQEDMDILDWFKDAVKRHLLIESDEQAAKIADDLTEGVKAFREVKARGADIVQKELRAVLGDEGYDKVAEEVLIIAKKLSMAEEE